MNKKYSSILGLASILSSLDSMANYGLTKRGSNQVTPNDFDIKPKKKIIPKGCKVYNIKGVEVVAINEKSAIKKIIKKAHSEITRIKGKEYAPDVHEIQEWINKNN